MKTRLLLAFLLFTFFVSPRLLQAQDIANNTVDATQTICAEAVPVPLTGSTPTGGTGVYTYLWLSSVINATDSFTVASGVNNTKDYSPAALTQNIWYKRVVMSGGYTSDTSDAVQITVNTPVSIVAQPVNAYICGYSGTGSFTVNALGDNLTYQWQVRLLTDSGTVWSDMSTQNTNTLTVNVDWFGVPLGLVNLDYSIYVYGYFRCKVTNGCNTVYTDSVSLGMDTHLWTGAADSSWTNPANWACGESPVHYSNVVVSAIAPHNPVLSGNVTVNFLTIEAGRKLSLGSNDHVLRIEGDILGTGQYDGSKGTTIFSNSSWPQFVPSGTYYNLATSSNGFAILGNTVIKNSIVATSRLRLGGELVIDSNATYSIGLASTEYQGKLTIRNIGVGGRTGAVLFPVGGRSSDSNPIYITNTGIADAFSVQVIDSVTNQYAGNTPIGAKWTNNVVNRTWLVRESTEGGSNVTMTVQWSGNAWNELPGFDRTASYLSRYDDNVWIPNAASAAKDTTIYAQTYYTQTHTNISSFGAFAVGSNGTLPVQLIAFKAVASGKDAILTWSTASEVNNNRFEILRSIDGETFEPIGKVKGNGTSATQIAYSFVDKGAATHGAKLFYRLKQIDNDGSFTHSSVVNVSFTDAAVLAVSPNPFSSEGFTLHLNDAQSDVKLHVTDINGKELAIYTRQMTAGINITTADEWKSGVYFLRVINGGQVEIIKLVKL